MQRFIVIAMIAVIALSLGAYFSPCFAQGFEAGNWNGEKITVPESSLPRPGRMNTNYFIVGSTEPQSGPPTGAETPGSLACVYQLVSGPTGCPIATSTTVPTGGVGAIAVVDAGYYPTAESDLQAFSTQFGLPTADFTVVFANGKQPPIYQGWLLEQALDIEWAHAMAPNAKLFLVESTIFDTDPTWQAVEVAGNLVAQNGGGVVSMSFGIPEYSTETQDDKHMAKPGVVYFAGSGDFGLNFPFYPAASPNVVAVGGTLFNRNSKGDFTSEEYGGGGGAISPYEPIPPYQNIVKSIVGTHRGFPDVASDYCCAAVYLGGWTSVGGTSWASPTFAGIVNAAGQLKKSSHDELKMIYSEYGNSQRYKQDFYDITKGNPHWDSRCNTGWDLCAGVGSPRTYTGK